MFSLDIPFYRTRLSFEVGSIELDTFRGDLDALPSPSCRLSVVGCQRSNRYLLMTNGYQLTAEC